jgi:hypothetical protein
LVLYTMIIAIPRESRERRGNRRFGHFCCAEGKNIMVLTHRPRYIETATLPKLDEGTSSIAEGEQPTPAAPREDLSELPKVPAIGPAKTLKFGVEAKEEVAKEPKLGEKVGLPKILSPPADSGLPKITRAPTITPKRRRMASVLDTVMETTRALTPAPAKKIAEAAISRAEAEARPSAPAEMEPIATEDKAERESLDVGMAMEKDVVKKAKSPAPGALSEDIDFIIRHASGKRLSEEEIAEAKHYAQELKYPKGALVFNDTDEVDFLYCLSDNKEISICREMAKNMGFLKLEAGLSDMSKDDHVDSLAYNSLKVRK